MTHEPFIELHTKFNRREKGKMKRESILKRLISFFLVVAMMLSVISGIAPSMVEAASSTKELGEEKFNATSKYLHLGVKGKDIFDFNIKKSAQEEGARYTWYIKEDKGNPDTVSIDHKTGIVKAKEAGTAYIRCKITYKDGTIIRPEAKVIVRNNISAVDISNLPENMTIEAGREKDFNRKVTDTVAGKGEKTGGITRWEIKDDHAGVQEASDTGVVYPLEEGSFKIRAISFQSKDKYNQWLKDKAVNKKLITAASQWYIINVISTDDKAVVRTQGQLDKALASKTFKEVTLATNKAEKFLINKGEYLSKSLIVDAAKADVENYGTFKDITIKAIKDTTWIEYANGNIVYILDTELSFVIDKDSQVKRIVIDTPNSKVNLEINGGVAEILVLQPSQINLIGSNEIVPISVGEGAGGTKITSSIPLDLTLSANADIILNKGAEDTVIDKAAKTIEVKIDNKSDKAIEITTNKTNAKIIAAGESGVSNEASTPVPTTSNGGNNSSPIKVSAISVTGTGGATTITTKGGTLQLVATVTPSNASNKSVRWDFADNDNDTDTGNAAITPDGLLKAYGNGTITVEATSLSTPTVSGTVVITISGQDVTNPLEWGIDPISVVLKDGDNPPYQLMQINYSRTAAVKATLTITDKSSRKVYLTADSPENTNYAAMFQWSYRDLSSITNDSTQADLDALERQNDTQVAAGTEVEIKIATVYYEEPFEITYDYTITQEDVNNSKYYTAEQLAEALATIQGYATNSNADELTSELLVQAGATSINSANLAEYKVAIAAATAIANLGALQTLVATVNDNADIAAAKTAIEAATYTATQAEAGDADNASFKAVSLIMELDMGVDISVQVDTVSFEGAIAGTAGNADGTNGSYTFTVTISKGLGTSVTTEQLTMTITATPYDSTAQDNADIAAVKTAIEAATYTATQAEVGDESAAKSKVIDIMISEVDIKGTSGTVVSGDFAVAIAGTAGTPAGTNGSFKFTVKINKGSGTEVITGELTMTITATPYDPIAQDNADIAAAKAAIEVATYTATQAEAGDTDAAEIKVLAEIHELDLKAGMALSMAYGDFVGAVAGTAGSPSGTNGRFKFAVKINKGSGTEVTTDERTMTITATPYDSTAQDNADIAAVKTAIEAAIYTATQAEVANAVAAIPKVLAIMASQVDLKETNGNIDLVNFTAAIAGDAGNPAGTNGSFIFTVTISKGLGTAVTTAEKTMTIIATQYDSTDQDNADIAAVKTAIEAATYTATQAEVGGVIEAKAKVSDLIRNLSIKEGTALEISNGSYFVPAIAGTAENVNGTNGSLRFTVKINKGLGTEVTTVEKTMTITATPYVKSDAKAITAFSFAGLDPVVLGIIDEEAKTIALTVPHGIDVTALVATFTNSAKSVVYVSGNVQTSGTTANDFTNIVAYSVTAEDGSSENYTVDVTVAAAPNTYTVTFAAGTTDNDLAVITGATGYVATATATEGVAYTAPVLVAAGYTFEGWFTDATCTTAYVPAADAITADITLYAKFIQ